MLDLHLIRPPCLRRQMIEVESYCYSPLRRNWKEHLKAGPNRYVFQVGDDEDVPLLVRDSNDTLIIGFTYESLVISNWKFEGVVPLHRDMSTKLVTCNVEDYMLWDRTKLVN